MAQPSSGRGAWLNVSIGAFGLWWWLGPPPQTRYRIAQGAQLVTQHVSERPVGAAPAYRRRDRLQVTINPVEATGYEFHGVKLAGGIVASVRRPAWGTARWVRHVSLRKVGRCRGFGDKPYQLNTFFKILDTQLLMKTGASAAVADNISWACERPRMFVKRPISASSVGRPCITFFG